MIFLRRRFSSSCSVSLIFTALCLVIASCATVVPPTPEPQVSGKRWEAGELIQSLAQRRAQFRSLRSLARLDYAGPDGKGNVQEAVVVQRPDRLRLETLTFLGAVLIVTVDDKEIIGYHPREGIFVRGRPSTANLLRYTQIPLRIEDITALLLGLPPLDPNQPSRQEDNALVFFSEGRKHDALTFDAPTPVPTKWERFNDTGAVEMSARFLDYINTAAGQFPSRIQIEAQSQRRKLEVRYQEPEFNVSLGPELFTQQKPAHAQELPLEALGG